MSGTFTLRYYAYMQNHSWTKPVESTEPNYESKYAGMTGDNLILQAIRVEILDQNGQNQPNLVEYQAHVQNIGWMEKVKGGETAGTIGRNLRAEAFKINLNGDAAQLYNIEYRCYIQKKGWGPWAKNGEMAGTEGKAKRTEAIQIKLTPK
ncbi:hypothetical protein M9Y10_007892 [Tritrichomonas musculus]|uniref:Clostridial hydrophobic W n=1 Tax=Tritrichomonas musculus TaxID=1915356 RepID=A0ABR2J2M3_9EUKA